MFKAYNKNNQNDVNEVDLESSLLTLSIFHIFSSVPFAGFEQVNVCWVKP